MDTDTIQIAIRYASKMRKMQLANRLSDLACNIQEQEEEDAKVAAAAQAAAAYNLANEECESQDMFETQGDDVEEEAAEETNPFLAAKMKKEAKSGKTTSILKESQSESRNPFKKSLNTSR